MIGSCPAFERVLDQATLAARSDARVLLTGESGTGKELLAAHLHAESPFANGPFVKVNCAAIPTELIESELFGHEKGAFTGATAARRGKFELADGGTLFLDEVGDLHAASQAKLLRVLQEGEFHRVGGEQAIKVSVRVISATNRDLQELVNQQKFREDLYYRLCVVPVRVPALRERREDIRALADYFLAEFCARNNFKSKFLDPEVAEQLEDHHWPGNIRELRNTVERMAILTRGDVLTAESIPVEIRLSRGGVAPKGNLREAKESAEREHILRALDEAKWNVSSAARALGMERTNLHKRIRALGITAKENKTNLTDNDEDLVLVARALACSGGFSRRLYRTAMREHAERRGRCRTATVGSDQSEFFLQQASVVARIVVFFKGEGIDASQTPPLSLGRAGGSACLFHFCPPLPRPRPRRTIPVATPSPPISIIAHDEGSGTADLVWLSSTPDDEVKETPLTVDIPNVAV